MVSDYETDKLRLNAEMILRFAEALDVSADELLQRKQERRQAKKQPSIKLSAAWSRSKPCRSMSSGLLLTTIDNFSLRPG